MLCAKVSVGKPHGYAYGARDFFWFRMSSHVIAPRGGAQYETFCVVCVCVLCVLCDMRTSVVQTCTRGILENNFDIRYKKHVEK